MSKSIDVRALDTWTLAVYVLKSEAFKSRSICCNLLQVSSISYQQTRHVFELDYMYSEMYN